MTSSYFAQTLTDLRELAGLTRVRLAALVHVSPSTISRWEHGEATPNRDNAEILDKALKADGKLREAWRIAKGHGGLPEWARGLDSVERAARHLTSVTPALVPGYLQCPEVARGVFRAAQPLANAEDIDPLVALRCGRLQDLPDMEVTAVFPMSAVSGLPEPLRRAQATHLLEWVSTGRVGVHLIPEGSVLLSPASPLLVYRLRTGDQAVVSDHADGNVFHTPDTHARLTGQVTAALTASLPLALSIEALRTLT